MIQELKIICPGKSGSKPKETAIISNGRLLFKDKGRIDELFGNFFQHMNSMPDECAIQLLVTGKEEHIEKLNSLLDELSFENNIFSPLPYLTPRELQILDLLHEGKNEKEISEIFSVGYQTIRNHCRDMHHKFHCKNNGEMLAAARRLGLLH